MRQRARDSVIKRERSDKQWRLADQDDVHPTWENYADFFFGEEDPQMMKQAGYRSAGWGDWMSDYSYYDGIDYDYGDWGDCGDEDWDVPEQPAVLSASLSLLEAVEDEEVGEGGVLAILGLY